MSQEILLKVTAAAIRRYFTQLRDKEKEKIMNTVKSILSTAPKNEGTIFYEEMA